MITFLNKTTPQTMQCCRRSNVFLLNKITQPLNRSGVCLCLFGRGRDYISYIVGRGVLIPYFMKTHYSAYPPPPPPTFSNFVKQTKHTHTHTHKHTHQTLGER